MLFRSVISPGVRQSVLRAFHRSPKLLEKGDFENPIARTGKILLSDVINTFKNVTNQQSDVQIMKGIPTHTDIVIIGGGAIGSSIAYWLKEKSNQDSFGVVVVEKDFSYSKCSTALSVGGLRQQFSLPENIQLSLYGAEFIRTLKSRFGPKADVSFTPHGYLVLASEEGADQLLDNSKLQNELGAVNIILQKHQIKDRFPWMNVDDVAVGCLGLEKEGWFDPWAMLQLLKKGAVKKGAHYINAEAVEFLFDDRPDLIIEGITRIGAQHPRTIVVQTPDGEKKTINFALCIIAAGPDSGKVAEMLGIGVGSGILSIPLPVERRKRYVYVFDCEKNPPGLNSPLTIDYTGAYFRRDGLGGKFIGGISPELADEPETTNLDVSYEFFDQHVWPVIANRVPAFNAVKIRGAWSGFYEYNKFDENGIVGPHPGFNNVYIASGFSGHGIQQAPAIGRAVAELILDGNFQTIDLARLGFDRLLVERPLLETAIV